MERLQNPFSLYDFLGYLIPGSIAVYFILFLLSPDSIDWIEVFEYYQLDQAVMIFPFTVVSYVLGHIISYLSSVTIEKYSIWSVGYPSKYLLGIRTKGYWDIRKGQSTTNIDHMVRWVSRIILVVLLMPISLFDFIFGKHFNLRFLYTRELDSFTKEVINSNLNKYLNAITEVNNPQNTGNIADQNYFLTIYHYCLEHARNHQNKFQNYVAMYGFLRSLSFLFILIFWILLFSKFPFGQNNFLIATTLTAILSYITYMGYNKFTRRFSLEVFMAFVTISKFTNDSFVDDEDNDHRIFTDWSGG